MLNSPDKKTGGVLHLAYAAVCAALLVAAAPTACATDSAVGFTEADRTDYDFVLANLDKNSAYVKYGAVTLERGGKADIKLWTANERDPIPARLDVGAYSTVVESEPDPQFHDQGVKILSDPTTFRGGARHVEGDWWLQNGGICLRFEDNFALYFEAATVKATSGTWGKILTNKNHPTACTPNAAAHTTATAPDAIVGVLTQRIFDRKVPTINAKFQVFDGSMSRLNGWDPACPVLKWDNEMMKFVSDLFAPAGKDVWRNIKMEPQKNAAPMAVFSYLSFSQKPVPEIGRVVIMNVGHDFNRNGRMDDDWGHIYAGFPILSSAGDLGGVLLFDFSTVGIKEAPQKGGCVANGAQLTHTLGLIMYLSSDLHVTL
jgi:hypothetical protein